MSPPVTASSLDMPCDTPAGGPHASAFDALAETYDDVFTFSEIGRAQRDRVWRVLEKTFQRGDSILELNCGTGEDALFLGKRGMRVLACDASAEMVRVGRRRLAVEAPQAAVEFRQLNTEYLEEATLDHHFDGAFSNFSGLNCVADLQSTAASLAGLVRPGASLLLCLSTRFCLIEILYFLCRGNFRKAFRRCKGYSTARIGGCEIRVHYLTARRLRSLFAPHFRLLSVQGVGVAIPPSYCEAWVLQHPAIFKLLRRLERIFGTFPLLRATGDHVLLHFQRETSR